MDKVQIIRAKVWLTSRACERFLKVTRMGDLGLIQAVYFDLYETLITEWDGNRKKAKYSTDKLGIDPEVFSKEWRKRKAQQEIGAIPDYSSALKDIMTHLELSVEPEVIEFLERERIAGKSKSFLSIESDVIEVLKELKGKGLRIGLISNCSIEDVEPWDSCDLAPYFDDVIFSFQVGFSKPNPGIYHLACERMNVDPKKCIFIGDGGSNELYGASEVGMKAYHATWFQPSWRSKQITGFPKLKNTIDIIDIIEDGLE